MITEETKKGMENLSKVLAFLSEEINTCLKEDREVTGKIDMTNTGMVEGPSIAGMLMRYNLGAKAIDIHLDFPNRMTLQEAIVASQKKK
jgi:hypothetical protein